MLATGDAVPRLLIAVLVHTDRILHNLYLLHVLHQKWHGMQHVQEAGHVFISRVDDMVVCEGSVECCGSSGSKESTYQAEVGEFLEFEILSDLNEKLIWESRDQLENQSVMILDGLDLICTYRHARSLAYVVYRSV